VQELFDEGDSDRLSLDRRVKIMQELSQLAYLKVENEKDLVIVPVSTGKPEIPDTVERKWQRIVDLVARIMQVPTGLITRLTTENLEIFVASATSGNPYKKDDRDRLGIGMFCETVAGRRSRMLVQDTGESVFWNGNPHAGLGMHSYLGVPIQWQDGEVFGTFCMLDDKTSRFTAEFQELMLQFKEIIEADLNYILLYSDLKKKISLQDLQLREVHHRIKNHFNLLITLITLREMEHIGNIHEVLQDMQGKIRTLSLLHEKLHMSGNSETLSLETYITDLCRVTLRSLLGMDSEPEISIDPVILSLDYCVPVGLIVSELVSNSVKYAFKGHPDPKIRLSIKKEGEGRLALAYSDNGPGYPAGIDPAKTSSLGLNLVKMMTEQLGGTMVLDNRGGACYRAVLQCQPEKGPA
jgi:two-component sensor histidine kinase